MAPRVAIIIYSEHFSAKLIPPELIVSPAMYGHIAKSMLSAYVLPDVS
jgi:hypothetical protein